jgi:small subunit ribosomal protein S6
LETVVKKLYEAMFLVDSAQAASDWDGVNKSIETILGRADAEIVSMRKWDERKLTYEIRGLSRGTYILCYFRADGTKIRDIERDVQLSERVIRVLILSAEVIDPEDIERDTPIMQAEKQSQKAFVEPEESFAAEESETSSDASVLPDEQSIEAESMETEQLEPLSQTELEKNVETESAPSEVEPGEEEEGVEASS